MKRATNWGGIYLIPETNHDLACLDQVFKSELLGAYDDGEVEWVLQPDIGCYSGAQTPPPKIQCPMGRYLWVGR